MKKIYLFVLILVFSTFLSKAQSQKNDLNLVVSALPLLGKSGNFSGVNGFVFKPSFLYYLNSSSVFVAKSQNVC